MCDNKCRHARLRTCIRSNTTYDSVIIIAVTNVPLVITVGAVTEKPIVVDGKVEAKDVINLTLTLDHRYTDGANASALYKKFLRYLNDPDKCDEEFGLAECNK